MLSRQRHRRLRRSLATERRRIGAATGAALKAQERALHARPGADLPVAPVQKAERELRALARELGGRADGDGRVQAAARGVGELADGYAALAAAERVSDPQKAADLTTRAVAALRAAEQQRRTAGDAWPL
ncbi:hypothetical protein VSS74_30480 [Conexibacter stalactiti]|uniref:Uncharacterized protein n=1 Tax=Conexibacter stalactiti TaxID=1940611 RepID=A0ABU4HZT7_9ACTN|nr:hypothetical protein [Conexibacter stalactiti]MDW5598725.1 hypothetical protein [Conexibacter stalactiti]MEC5039367.1 hypothetical protein [Conexibacter stalactiti]